jgi:dihydroflavonol-4-reductase
MREDKMSVLVTGGTGFVGGAIVRALVKQGNNVRVLARRTSKTEHLNGMGVEIVYGDILNKESIKAALHGCDTVYHAAALYELWGLDKQALIRTEVEGTQNVMEAALESGVDKIVYTSTSVAIGEGKGEVGTETTKHRGYFLSKYEQAKVEAEQVATSYLDKNLPIIIVNPAAVYGPGDFKPTGRAVMDLINGRMLGLFSAFISYVYIDDVGMGHTLAAAKGRVGERYILSGNIVTMHELARMVCELSGAKMPPTVPSFLAGMNASFGEMLSRVTRRPPILSSETFRLLSHGFQVDGAKAAKELDIAYTPLEEGLRRTILWYWEQGLLKRKPACI